MDISNEANVGSFSIGPSTIVGRAIAFRVLFCKSLSQTRHELFRVLLNAICRFRTLLDDVISWIHPENPQGILAIVTVIAFLLKRYSSIKLKAEVAYRRKFWRNMMRAALTYEEWAHAAKMLDKETPRTNESHLYDEELVRNKLRELQHRRQKGSLRDIIFWMRADLFRNLGNMCNPELHKGRLQIPRLIKEYINEVSTQLRMVCDSDSEELSLEEKLSFMHETRHAFGRTALLLSGGASLGAFHVGVAKALVEHKLLPRIIAGSSVGSIMCAIIGTRSWPELQSFFEDSLHSLRFFDKMGGIFTVVRRVMTHGAVHEIQQLQILLRQFTSNLTFQEAYDMTGRILGITVCSPRKHEPPRCLNYLTSPHVVIWSAVTASCAFPGLFEAQELMAKNRKGEIVPYHPPFNLDPEEGSTASSRRWRDGSLEIDLPMIQLKELFNVNHFIVSQANPHIAPLLRMKEFFRACGGNFAAKLAHLAEMEAKHRFSQILALGFPLGGLAKLFAQDWEGDITVVMPATIAQYLKIIQNPSYVEVLKSVNLGRRCAWEKLSAIKSNCGIELALDECVAILNHMKRLRRSAKKAAAAAAAASHGPPNSARFSASKRIPSWNCIARENSTGSLEEDYLTEVASTHHPSTGGSSSVGSSSGRAWRVQRHDGSDSDSESIEMNTWTRSGGPLMRTASANKFIDFVQNLDMDELNIGLATTSSMLHSQNSQSPRTGSERSSESLDFFDGRDISNRVSSSILLTEGDFLQPERISNGIVFNVVKKEDLALTNRSHDSETHTREVECMLIDCLEKDIDLSSASECNGDEEGAPERDPEGHTEQHDGRDEVFMEF